MADDLRPRIGVVLDLHTTTVGMEVVECRCGWLTKRGEEARSRMNDHLADVLVESLTPVIPTGQS